MINMRRVAAELLVVISFYGCGLPSSDDGTTSHLANVFGPGDPRTVATPAPGLVLLESGCTGAMVGRRLVLSAAHCLVTARGDAVEAIPADLAGVQTAQTQARSAVVRRVWYGAMESVSRARAFAVAELESDLVEESEILGVADGDVRASRHWDVPWLIRGYSVDAQKSSSALWEDRSALCRSQRFLAADVDGVKPVDVGLVEHSCAVTVGTSGAPITTRDDPRTIIALQTMERRKGYPFSLRADAYSSDLANLAIPSSEFASVVAALRKTVDRGMAATDAATLGSVKLADPPPRFASTGPQSVGRLSRELAQQLQGRADAVTAACYGLMDLAQRVNDRNHILLAQDIGRASERLARHFYSGSADLEQARTLASQLGAHVQKLSLQPSHAALAGAREQVYQSFASLVQSLRQLNRE